MMNVDEGRGKSFAVNQDQGFWAEQLLRSLPGDVQFIYFGLSDPIDPRARAYRPTRRKHRYILVLEGKRPDFLAFPKTVVTAHPQILECSERPLGIRDFALLHQYALAGVEIKSSLQHYATRQVFRAHETRMPNISITIKDEEFADLGRWQTYNSTPRIMVMQVFVDAIYWTPYAVFCNEMAAGRTRRAFERKTKKWTRYMEIRDGLALRFADIVVTQPDFLFRITLKGEVGPVGAYPSARLENMAIPDFSRL